MQKYVGLVISLVCCSCATVPTKQQIQQNIISDDAPKAQSDAIKESDAYKQVQEYVKTLNEIDKHKSFSKADYDKVVSIYGNSKIDSISDTYNNCWSNLTADTSSHYELSWQIQQITNSLRIFANNNCKKYLNSWQNKSAQTEILSSCKDILKEHFFDSLFSDMNINTESIQSKKEPFDEKKRQEEIKKQQEEIKKWEKRTGCKSDKLDNMVGRIMYYYEVFQQTSDGTLVSLKPMLYELRYANYPEMFFITKNKNDSALVDGATITSGIFQNMGNYQYVTVTGATKTVKKYKRCE